MGAQGGTSYERAVSTLVEALKFGIHPSLDGIRVLLEALGRPQDAYSCVQVAGTNGKSSVTRMTAAILSAHGIRAGAYTSPHMDEYLERMEIDVEVANPNLFGAAVAEALEASVQARKGGYSEPFTEFELLTAAALWAFAEEGVDIAVLEVGMGGRWDATSVVDPAVATITGISVDHLEHLGDTREMIAADKAQIIKRASAPVFGPGTAGVDDVLLARAEACDTHARAVRYKGVVSPVSEELTIRYHVTKVPDRPCGSTHLDVRGVHASYSDLIVNAPSFQAANAATALATAEAALGRALDESALRSALVGMRFPCRFELLAERPPIIVDGAHNPEAALVLADAVREAFPLRKPILLVGILSGKDAEGIARALAPVASTIVVTRSSSKRAFDPDELAHVVCRTTGIVPMVFGDVRTSLEALIKEAKDGLVVTGSITTAAEARRLLRDGTVASGLLESR
ncbi:MAG: Mur ligase family protein [Coriobacteriia bacterium]|nr:Mur ligase family protein [Coriobacteriia bacterium]